MVLVTARKYIDITGYTGLPWAFRVTPRDNIGPMNVSAQAVVDLIWKLGALVSVVPVLSVIGVWLLARFTTVFDAYAGERAKLQVQFDNVAKLVEQTRVLTATTETIKTNLSDEVWDRQERWSYRRDFYVRLIGSMTDLINAEVKYLMYEATQRDTKEQAKVIEDTFLQFNSLLELAPLIVPKVVMITVLRFPANRQDTIFTSEGIKELKTRLNAFRIEARKDLGYEVAD